MAFAQLSKLGLLALTLAACHPNGGTPSDTTAITNRPQAFDRFIAVMKLQTPALLSTAVKVNGKIVVDDSLKAQITAEQAGAFADVQAISPQAKLLYNYKMVLNAIAVIAP